MKRRFLPYALLTSVCLISLFFLPNPVFSASKVIKLKYSNFMPATSDYGKVYIRWMDKIEKETNGRVKFYKYWSGTLLDPRKAWYELQKGTADLGENPQQFSPEALPLSCMSNILYYGVPNYEVQRKVAEELWHTTPELRAEYKPVKILGFTGVGACWLSTVDRPVRKMADIKGMTIRDMSQSMLNMYPKFGAAGIRIPMSETYAALQKSIIQGVTVPMEQMKNSRYGEVTKYHTNIYSFQGWYNPAPVMNLDTWNSLPPDIQEVFNNNIEWVTHEIWDTMLRIEKEGIEYVKGISGHELIDLSKDERDKMNAILDQEVQKIAAAVDEKGARGTELWKKARALIKQYSQE